MASVSPLAQEFVSLRDAMNQLFEESFTPFFGQTWRGTGTQNETTVRPIPLDVYTTSDEAVIVAAVPGIAPEDLDVTIERGTVTLSGKVHDVAASQEAKSATWYLHELWSGQFRRTVSLPFEIDAASAEASFEHGMLRIRLPKAAQARPTKIAINAGEGWSHPRAIVSGKSESTGKGA